MKQVPLTRGQVVTIDDSDFNSVTAKKWFALKAKHGFYAARWQRKGGIRRILFLHRWLVGAPAAQDVDHRDGDKLNCQRLNLRVCSRRNNIRGFRVKLPGTYSIFRGVTWEPGRGKWKAAIRLISRTKNLGRFTKEADAARAYDAAARRFFGEFAQSNFL